MKVVDGRVGGKVVGNGEALFPDVVHQCGQEIYLAEHDMLLHQDHGHLIQQSLLVHIFECVEHVQCI